MGRSMSSSNSTAWTVGWLASRLQRCSSIMVEHFDATRDAVWATLFHSTSTDADPHHTRCLCRLYSQADRDLGLQRCRWLACPKKMSAEWSAQRRPQTMPTSCHARVVSWTRGYRRCPGFGAIEKLSFEKRSSCSVNPKWRELQFLCLIVASVLCW